MNAKRYRKLDGIAERYPLFRRFGAAKPKLGVICWGSTVGPLREAIDRLGNDSGVGVFAPQMLMPLPAAPLQDFIDSCEEILIVELSYSAQFERYLRGFVDFPRTRTHVYKRSGGKNLTSAEIETELQRLLAGTPVILSEAKDLRMHKMKIEAY